MTAPSVPFPRPPRALSVASFVSSFDRFAVSPMLVLIAADLRVPFAAAVAAASGYFLAYGLFQPLWGVLSDRFGRVRLMRWALVGAALAGAASALVPALGALIACRIVAGACFGAVVPTSLTYLGDTYAPSVRQRALSELMGVMALGTAVATGFGGVLADLIDWRLVFTVPAIMALACSVALRGLPEPARPDPADPADPGGRGGIGRHVGAVLRTPWALLVFGLAFVEGAVLLGTMAFLATALEHRGVTATVAGFGTAAYGLGVWGFSRLVRPLSQRWPVWLLIVAGGTQMCAAYAVVAARVDLVTVVITALLLGGGWSFMHSSLQTWATSVAPRSRGTAVAFFAAALFVGSAVSSWLAGPVAEQGAYAGLFGVSAAVAVPLTVVAALARRRYGALGTEPA